MYHASEVRRPRSANFEMLWRFHKLVTIDSSTRHCNEVRRYLSISLIIKTLFLMLKNFLTIQTLPIHQVLSVSSALSLASWEGCAAFLTVSSRYLNSWKRLKTFWKLLLSAVHNLRNKINVWLYHPTNGIFQVRESFWLMEKMLQTMQKHLIHLYQEYQSFFNIKRYCSALDSSSCNDNAHANKLLTYFPSMVCIANASRKISFWACQPLKYHARLVV